MESRITLRTAESLEITHTADTGITSVEFFTIPDLERLGEFYDDPYDGSPEWDNRLVERRNLERGQML